MKTIKEQLLPEDSSEYPDDVLCGAWNQLWNLIKKSVSPPPPLKQTLFPSFYIGQGISDQRRAYLIQCVTPVEMRNACEIWNRVKKEVETEKYSTMVAETAIKVCFLKALTSVCVCLDLQ